MSNRIGNHKLFDEQLIAILCDWRDDTEDIYIRDGLLPSDVAVKRIHELFDARIHQAQIQARIDQLEKILSAKDNNDFVSQCLMLLKAKCCAGKE